jgi:thioredoxin 1
MDVETRASKPTTRQGKGSADPIPAITAEEFESQVLQAQGPVVVEFMSYSCAHCRAIESVLQQVAQMVRPQQQMLRVNVALDPDLSASYGVQGTPTLVMFMKGQEVGRVEGPPPDEAGLLAAVTQPFRS